MTLEKIHWKDCLRRERIQRNWRQSDLAEQLRTSVVTIQRWEKGAQKPGPYFRLKLSTLFGKSAEELGFVTGSTALSAPTRQEAPGRALGLSSQASEPGFWNIPYPRNPHFTGREEQLEHLAKSVFSWR